MALAPRTPYLAAAAGQVPFAAFVGVALLRLCAADPSHFLLGRLHGARAAAALAPAPPAHRRRRPGRVRRGRPAGRRTLVGLWDRLGLVLVALSPSGKVLLLAGASRLTHRRVASAAVAGTLVQVVVLYVAGRAVAGPAGRWPASWRPTPPSWCVATVAVVVGHRARPPTAGRRRAAPAGAGQPALRPGSATTSSRRRPKTFSNSGRLRRAPHSSICRSPVPATSHPHP